MTRCHGGVNLDTQVAVRLQPGAGCRADPFTSVIDMSESSVSPSSDSGIAGLIDQYRRLSAQSVPLVMATVIETLGSTYRKAGARMLIDGGGRFHGLIGGGCFEGDLYEQTQSVFETGEPRLLFYDMRAPEDALWGLGLGCNGAVRILLQRLDDSDNDPLIRLLEQFLRDDSPAVVATVCDGPDAGRSYRLLPDGNAPASWRESMRAEARAVAALGRPALVEQEADTGNCRVFYDYLHPAPRLLLVGAGADAVPVLRFARQLDWRVLLVDHREAYAQPARFPGAEAVLQVTPPELAAAIDNRCIDAAVLMTHNIDYDARFLRQLNNIPCRYLGLLGPVARRERLLEMTGLEAGGFDSRLHGPVGLDIGGKSPESIALSLVTEIHAVLHERDGRPLRDKRQPLQSRPLDN